MKPDPEIVVLELADAGDPFYRQGLPERPFSVRLRAALKRMLRADGLRCRRLADGAKVEIVTRTNPTGTQCQGRD